ncbi:MAG TPA: hypothetical protein VNO30_00845 [Kofleriaceae bacterium]|nr:hypothetical protein [Kofleriaceae bacterium]
MIVEGLVAVILGFAVYAWVKSYPAIRQRRALRRAKIWRIGELPEDTIGRLIGTARPVGHTLRAPISGRECVCWHVRVDAGSNEQAHIIIDEQKAVRFVLEDGSGRVIVEPEGAAVLGPLGCTITGNYPELKRKHAHERTSGWHSKLTERERVFLTERADRFNQSWRKALLEDHPALAFYEEIVEVGERICVAGAGIREGDPDAEPSEGYRTAPPTRLRFTSSPKLRLLITDAPSKS